MQIETTRFGQLDISEDDIFKMPKGMPGFLGEKEFVLLPYQENSPFFFWQSVKNKDLTFLVVDPFVFFPEYQFELKTEDEQELRISDQNLPQVFCVVTITDDVKNMTANLLAPLVLNKRDKLSSQVVLERTPYQTKHRLLEGGI